LSVVFLLFGSAIVNPFCLYLIKKKKGTIAKLILLTDFSLSVYVTTNTTPYDDGGRFFFVPISLLTILIFHPEEKKSMLYGLIFPFICYLLSVYTDISKLVPSIHPEHIEVEISKRINFIGVYSISLIEVFFFTKFIKKLREITAHQSKFSALGVMSSGIAHEINNPLTVIKAKVHQIKKNINNSSPDKTLLDLDIISKTTDRIHKIVNGLRSFARDSSEDPFERLTSKQVIQASLDLCHERFHQFGVQVIVNHNVDFVINGRETQLVQVLVNLLSNAFDAITNLNEKWIQVDVNDYTISITDSGSGIPKAIAEKLMQPFFTTKEVGKGVGLGLSISKGIIADHGGKLFLDTSAPNTRFVIEFPTFSS
jgi:C4-dicarboxylate-specific signal transduction histidine kinase